MRKNYLLILLFLLLGIGVRAQTRTITGLVTDSASKETIVGVTITIKGSNTATASDVNGKFSIKTSNLENVTIGAKFIGYKYQEFTLKAGETKHDFKMVAINSDLNEVVVTGFGTTLKSKLLGSVAEIKAADVEDLPVANLATALVDRVAGVGVSVASGKPGAPSTLTIRSPNTFGGGGGITSDPLYVIDGLISTPDDFNNLDASMVESISFLKDSQAAIYGAAGDKGVVLVTTKKGKPGKARISYTGYFGTSDAASLPKVMSGLQLATFLNDDWALNNSPNTSRFSQADLNFIASNPYPSWQSQLWHSSQTKRHTINVSGGSDKITFFGGGSYYDEGGNFGDISIKKYSIRSGMTAKISDDITAYISLNTNYSTDYRNSAKSGNTDTENYTVEAIFLTPQWVPLTINGKPLYWNGPNVGTWNPLALFNSGTYSKNADQSLNLNSTIEWRPSAIKGLTAKAQYGKTNTFSNGKNYYPSYLGYQFVAAGQNGLLYTNTPQSTPSKIVSNSDQVLEGTGYNNSYELIGSLDYTRSINNHTFDVLFVTEQTEANGDAFSLYRTTQQVPGSDQFFAFLPSSTTLQSATPTESGKRSYLVRANYDYANKYLVQFIGREDGSANFPPDKRWGFFPSVGLGWRVSEEDFFKDHLSKYINSLKFRFNIGLVGDDRVNSYQYKNKFTPYSGTILFGNTIVNGIDPSIIANPNITWEHSRTEDFGIDATFLNNRMSVTVDFWNKHIYDGFQDISSLGSPLTFGAASGVINYDSANTWGSEFSISYSGIINKNWGWDVSMNTGYTNGQTLQAYYSNGDLGTDLEYQNISIGQLTRRYTGSNYGLISTGIIRTQSQLNDILAKNPNYTIDGRAPQLGYMNFEDTNHDGKIDANDAVPMYSSIASPIAMGLNFGVTYKTFKLSVNGRLALGGKVFVGSDERKAPSTNLNGAVFWADHWSPSNPNGAYPRADAPLVNSNSTFWARNGSTCYINNATLSYALPKALSERFKIPELRFLVSGTNLWTLINPYDYKDPRQSGIYSYPTLRTISFGVNLSL